MKPAHLTMTQTASIQNGLAQQCYWSFFGKSMDLPSNPPNGMVIPYLISNNIATATKNGKLVRFVVAGVQYSTLRATNSATTN